MKNLCGKKILIRADSSIQIGTGHVMRMHVLATLLKGEGASVTFACRDFRGNLISFLKDQGYEVKVISSANSMEFLPDDYSSWLGSDAKDDVLQSFFGSDYYDLAIIDHYGAGLEWHDAARSYSKAIMVVDDEANCLIDCDILLNQNHYPKTDGLYEGKVPDACVKLIGAKYALLRREFTLHRENASTRTELKKLLIMMGGADFDQVTLNIVSHLDIDLDVTVVVGHAYSEFNDLDDLCNGRGFSLVRGAENIAELMGEADFCIGAGGSTSWERCCMKLPSAIFSVAENQVGIAENLSKAGAITYLGDPKYFDFTGLNNILRDFQSDTKKLNIMSMTAGELVDGNGSSRVLHEITNLI